MKCTLNSIAHSLLLLILFALTKCTQHCTTVFFHQPQVTRMDVETFRKLNDGGDLMLPSIVTANLALKYLESRGIL